MFRLARSPWPCSGGGAGHTGRSTLPGPDDASLVRTCALDPSDDPDARRFGGLAVAEDGAILAVASGRLSCIGPDAVVRWSSEAPCFAPPVGLAEGRILVVHQRAFAVLDPRGVPERTIPFPLSRDDSNVAPCIAPPGVLVATAPSGDVHRLEGDDWVSLGCFGYDILPPAAFADGSLCIGGYGGRGHCRLGLDGTVRWRTGFEGDRLATVGASQCSAASSARATEIRAPDGAPIGRYERGAVLSEHELGWAALSKGGIALLGPDGRILWERELPCALRWATQAVVDARGRIYAPCEQGVRCLAPDGQTLFETSLEGQPASVALLGPGLLGLLYGDRLCLASRWRGELPPSP